MLTPRDDTSKKYDLLDWFSDPNDIFLTFDGRAQIWLLKILQSHCGNGGW